MTHGDPGPKLYLIGSPTVIPRNVGTDISVVLYPGGETFQARVEHKSDRNPTVLKLFKLKYDFPPSFAKSDAVRFDAGGSSVRVPVLGAGKAMAALQQCIDGKLTEWGIDPKALAALRKPPTSLDNYDFITGDDYPQEALDRHEMGHVIARLQVDASGKVQDCKVVVSSRSRALDTTTCDLALKKGRFDPAIGAGGQPTAAPRVIDAIWFIM